ncbi:hypothetical protein DMC47_01270 [Nostoc sp. 3335mG]|nr:hypothetical protein DMC47_01270 [Nostoc sp. 3335mG]
MDCAGTMGAGRQFGGDAGTGTLPLSRSAADSLWCKPPRGWPQSAQRRHGFPERAVLMRTAFRSLSAKLRALGPAEAGVAAVEFALVVPIMLAVYLGCAEASSLLTADRKVQSVAGAMGDLVARSNKVISRDQLEDYFLAATSIMIPYDASGLVQTVIAVSVTQTGEATVLWSARFENGSISTTVSDYPAGEDYDLPEEMIAIAAGQTVIAAEVDYNYQPLLGVVFDSALDLHRTGLFIPRFGGNITLS